MTSQLFKMASKAERRLARRSFAAHPSAGLYKSLGSVTTGRAGHGNMRQMLKRVNTAEVRDLMRNVERGRRGGAAKYSKRDEQEQLNRLLGLLGPIGEVIRAVVGRGSTRDFEDSALDAAVNLIRAMGHEVLSRKGQPGHDRGLEAARQVLEEGGYTVTPPGGGGSIGDDGGTSFSWGDPEGTNWLRRSEVHVNSSNVYSYAWQPETENFGTLYVTFRAWTPGMRHPSASAGATYAYYAVPFAKFRDFARAAQGSAGGAVWDYLRVRGSVSDHQHPYELVGGVLMSKEEVYIPRKATDAGYFRRAVQVPRAGRGTWQRSTLASREFAPERGGPNRGQPNRGGPSRGR